MNCRELAVFLSDYLDSELDSETCALLETHMEECGNCRAFYSSFRITVSLYRRLPPEPLPHEHLEELLSFLRGKLLPPSP